MNCRQTGKALAAYLEGELDARRRAQLDAHVAGCARCAAELALQRRALQLLTAPKSMAQPEGLLAEFKQRLAAEAPAPRRSWRNPPWSWSLAGLTASAAAVALFISLQHGPPAAPTREAVVQIAQQPKEFGSAPDVAARLDTESLRSSARGRASADAQGTDTSDRHGNTSPKTATAPKPAGGPMPTPAHTLGESAATASAAAPPAVDKPAPEADREARAMVSKPQPSPAAVMETFERRLRNNRHLLADKSALPELNVPATETKKVESPLREQEGAGGPPAPPGAGTTAASTSTFGARSGAADARAARRDEPPLRKIAEAAPPRAVPAPSPAPSEARVEVTVHRPFPDPGDRSPTGAGGFGGGLAGAARGGAAAGGAPPGGPAGPQGPAGPAAGLAALPLAVAPEVAAALRTPIDAKVTNETLLSLTDRLSAAVSVPIVVEDAITRQLRVTADLEDVPLFRALETVATQANLVIAPRPGGITLQTREAQGEAEKQRVAPSVWSPAWGTLPRSGFAVTVAQSPAPNLRGRQAAGARAAGANGQGAGAVSSTGNKEAPPAQRRVIAADQALALQNQQTLKRTAEQLNALNQTPPLLQCPHCRQALARSATYRCPQCKSAVKPLDVKCASCGKATPAHCPQCDQPLATRAKAPGGR